MAGILDNKSRVLDAYITQEGRRQIANGELRVRYVTFSDADVYYTADAQSGVADVSNRIYLEPSNLPQDQIVFEADDSGRLRPFKALSDLDLASGQLTMKRMDVVLYDDEADLPGAIVPATPTRLAVALVGWPQAAALSPGILQGNAYFYVENVATYYPIEGPFPATSDEWGSFYYYICEADPPGNVGNVAHGLVMGGWLDVETYPELADAPPEHDRARSYFIDLAGADEYDDGEEEPEEPGMGFSTATEAYTVLSGPVFASTMKLALQTSIENFEKLRVIGSYDELFGEKNFAVGPREIGFVLTDDAPIKGEHNYRRRLNDAESLFNDPRLSQVDNFRYLPPTNRPALGSSDAIEIGRYPAWSPPLSRDDAFARLFYELSCFEQRGYARSVSFDPTSTENNLIGQVFEVGSRSASKLDVIHFGKGPVYAAGGRSELKDVFFVGKVMVDDNETQTFVHIFTLVFE